MRKEDIKIINNKYVKINIDLNKLLNKWIKLTLNYKFLSLCLISK